MSTFDILPDCSPTFFVPRLLEKPQDPILDSLKQNFDLVRTRQLPIELVAQCLDLSEPPLPAGSIWSEVIISTSRPRNHTLSWKASLQSSRVSLPSPFLSEQEDPLIYAAAQYNIFLPLRDPNVQHVYVTRDELFHSLQMTVCGSSSALHAWDIATETFIPKNFGTKCSIFLDGFGAVISASIIHRFVSIGTLMRRLEILTRSLRAKFGPTVHAFAHSLSSIWVLLRDRLVESPPWYESKALTLSLIWSSYSEIEYILVALADLCAIPLDKQPFEYTTIDDAPVPLLSLIYTHLETNMETHSPKEITAFIAFILDSTSKEYLAHICRTVGFAHQHPSDIQFESSYTDSGEQEEYPSFFPPELVSMLPIAKQSLTLLREAQHAEYLHSTSTLQGVRWLWTEVDILSAWDEKVDFVDDIPVSNTETEPALFSYQPDLAQFSVFDLEPGSSAGTANETVSLRRFLDQYPSVLPSITPTLAHLSSLVFTPLLNHVSTLSQKLVALFLSPTSHLCIKSHLLLLRSTILLTSPAFQSRVASALFSDSEDFTPLGALLGSYKPVHERKLTPDSDIPWAMGLAPTLMGSENTWPPGGADLSFLLRTVIVDSLGIIRDEVADNSMLGRKVFEESEYRLGFSIRDLPIGTGRERWLDPLAIEALDFLDLDYKPPHPTQVVLTDEILSKYSRVFTFVLRLMRVDAAIAALHRIMRNNAEPLFATLSSSQKLLLHFRFIAQAFVKSLTAYVSDTAIGANFDHFLSSTLDDQAGRFSDVFELTEAHSELLDDILSSCMLRSGQRALGDLIRRALSQILELCVLGSQLKRGLIKEYEAAPILQRNFSKFRATMATLTKVLKALADKHGTLSPSQPPPTHGRASGNTNINLSHLLMRLDMGDWWMKFDSSR